MDLPDLAPLAELLPALEFFVPAPESPLSQEVRDLEEDLHCAVRLLAEAASRLRTLVGAGNLGAGLSQLLRVLEADESEEGSALQARIEGLVAQGQEPKAVRVLRDVSGLTWDEVYALFDKWPTLSAADKQRWVRRHLFRQAIRA